MYKKVMVSIDAVNIDYEYKAFLNVVICTEWTFCLFSFVVLTFCSDLKYKIIAWFEAMCLCHKRLKENPQTSARWAVIVTGRARTWCLKSRGLFCFAVISFEFSFRGRLNSNIKCVLSTCVSLCAGCLFLQLPKAVRNINLNIPHIVFFFLSLSTWKSTYCFIKSLKCSVETLSVRTLASSLAALHFLSSSLSVITFAMSGDQIKVFFWAWEIYFSNVMYMEKNDLILLPALSVFCCDSFDFLAFSVHTVLRAFKMHRLVLFILFKTPFSKTSFQYCTVYNVWSSPSENSLI